MMGIFPKQTRINDIVARFSCHNEIFTLRPNEYEEVAGYKDWLRTALVNTSLGVITNHYIQEGSFRGGYQML